MCDPKKRVVVVEPHPIVRERLAELIGEEDGMEFCGEADDLKGGLALICSVRPDLAVVGIALRGSNGLDLIKQVRASALPTAILVLSMYEESVYARRVIAKGAMGYISENCTSLEIMAAIRQVLSGKIYLSPAMTDMVLHTLTTSHIAGPVGRSLNQLSDRELAVLEKIGQGQDSRQIAKALGVGTASVDTYRARIKEKLNLRNAFELMSFAIRYFHDLP
jgi:DNA-binding NarL/FixJ family response regulator